MSGALQKVYFSLLGMLMALLVEAKVTKTACPPSCDPPPCCKGNICHPSPYCGPNCLDPYSQEVNFKGEALYWVAQLGGLESAFGNTAIATTVGPGIIITTVTETDEEPEFEWRPGFRMGADYAFRCFDIEADWTHYNGRAHFNSGAQYGKWKIQYDTIDLIFGRRCCVAPCFYFKPFIGLRGLWVEQRLQSHLEVLFTAVTGDNTNFVDMNDKENIWGLGPELGLEGNWYLGKGFSLYASFDVVTYYGRFKGEYFDTDTFTVTISGNNSHVERSFNNIGTDGAVGIRWDKAWPVCSEALLMLKAGLEQHRIYDFSNLGKDGTLSLDGAVFGISAGYRY